MNKKDLKFLAKGSEGEVYTDGNLAYKFQRIDNLSVGGVDQVREYINHDFPNVVQIFNAFIDPNDEDGIIIVTELLNEIESTDLIKKLDNFIIMVADDEIEKLENIIFELGSEFKNEPSILEMLESIVNAAKQLGKDYMDLGFHNLMFCPKSNTYKQIDIF